MADAGLKRKRKNNGGEGGERRFKKKWRPSRGGRSSGVLGEKNHMGKKSLFTVKISENRRNHTGGGAAP